MATELASDGGDWLQARLAFGCGSHCGPTTSYGSHYRSRSKRYSRESLGSFGTVRSPSRVNPMRS